MGDGVRRKERSFSVAVRSLLLFLRNNSYEDGVRDQRVNMNGYWGKINRLVCECAKMWVPVKNRNRGLTPDSLSVDLRWFCPRWAHLHGLHSCSALALSQLWIPDRRRPEYLWGSCGPSVNQWGHLMGSREGEEAASGAESGKRTL